MTLHVESRERPRTWGRADGRPSAMALLDYANLVSEESERDSPLMSHLMIGLVRAISGLAPQIEHLEIRAYGGWLNEGIITSSASKAMRALEGANPFPVTHPARRHALLHGEIRIVNTLLSLPHVEFGETYRMRKRPPRIRLAKSPVPDRCLADATSCPAAVLKRFTKSASKTCPTPDCSVTCGEAFMTFEQKMVDTMIACDLIEASQSADLALVAVLTCDTDFLPPLIYASSTASAQVAVVTPDRCWRSAHIEMLQRAGVRLLPEEGSNGDA